MIAEIVTEAIRRLDDAGWCQEACRNEQGAICMGTALWDAAGLPYGRTLTPAEITVWANISAAAVMAIRKAFPDTPFSPESAIPKFNDFSSEEDVQLVLKTMLEEETT